MRQSKLKVIGITGGVGSGKSQILSELEKLCVCRIIRADELAKALEKKGEVCYEALIKLLGRDILSEEDEEIVPSKMASRIFTSNDSNILEKVNGIIHPEVKKRILKYIDDEKQADLIDYFFIEAALLIEDHYDLICDELWYVYADEDTRTKRLIDSRGYSTAKIKGIMESQLDDETFRKYCRNVIDNSGDIKDSVRQLEEILDIKR